MIFERKVGFVFGGDFCSAFKARFGFCFKKNPMKQEQKLLHLQNGFITWHISARRKLTKLNVGSLKSIYQIMWWLDMSKINFLLHLDKIRFKCLFRFAIFRILKNRLNRTHIYTYLFFLEPQVIWCKCLHYNMAEFVPFPKAEIKGSI